MKRFLFAATALLFITSATWAQSLKIGSKAPTFDGKLSNAATGGDMPYYKAADKNGLLVMFSCNTCPFVVKNQSTTSRAIKYAKANGVGVVILNSNEAKRGGDDSYDAMKAYGKEQGYDIPYLIDKDSRIADAFGANHTPEIFLFDKNKKLVYKGAMNDNPGSPDAAQVMYIKDAIDAVLAGKAPEPDNTKSIGCSIKRKS